MDRLTTDTPNGNFEVLMNFAYAKDRQVWLRGADDGKDAELCEYISKLTKGKCDLSPEEILEGSCMEDCFCELGALYAAATQAAELRARLKAYEDTGLTPEELDDFARQACRIRMAAGCSTLEDCDKIAKEGRLFVLPCKVGDTVFAITNQTDSGETEIVEAEIWQIRIIDTGFAIAYSFTQYYRGRCYDHSEIGNKVFLTREEAVTALEARKRGYAHGTP